MLSLLLFVPFVGALDAITREEFFAHLDTSPHFMVMFQIPDCDRCVALEKELDGALRYTTTNTPSP